jgi:serine phosphatase RsbU (regulator of sigma subunit)
VTQRAGSRSWLPHPLSVVVLFVSLALIGLLTWASWADHNSNEQRLLDVRVREAGSVLTAALPTVQTPLASAAELAQATNGDPQRFKGFIAPYVGGAGRPFVSASLWSLQPGTAQPSAVVGSGPAVAASLSQVQGLFVRAARAPVLSVTGMLNQSQPRLGYAFVAPGPDGSFAVYAESAIPPNRRLQIERNSAFSDLNYALYLGTTQRPADFVATSLSHLPVNGRHAVTTVPFGDSAFTLVMTARGNLGGGLSQDLPWVVGVLGTLLAVLVALATERLIRRRNNAEAAATELGVVAGENQRLYFEQRGLAEALQHALLPLEVPAFAGIEVSVEYRPGVGGVEIGGDWYDIIHLDDGAFLLVVGDVSGRGLRAATVMASLRYAIRAYAAEGDGPSMILDKLSELLSVSGDGHFATVLCALVDIERHQMIVANAGHLNPLLIVGHEARYVATDLGAPIGVTDHTSYTSATVPIPRGATLLAFTDGLIERRGEGLDVGLERMRQASLASNGSLDSMLTQVLHDLTPDGSDDDTAIVGVKWQA